MDGDSKEEFCTTCSVEVPSAFRNDDDDDKKVKIKKCGNWSKHVLNILLWVIFFAFMYLIFKKR